MFTKHSLVFLVSLLSLYGLQPIYGNQLNTVPVIWEYEGPDLVSGEQPLLPSFQEEKQESKNKATPSKLPRIASKLALSVCVATTISSCSLPLIITGLTIKPDFYCRNGVLMTKDGEVEEDYFSPEYCEIKQRERSPGHFMMYNVNPTRPTSPHAPELPQKLWPETGVFCDWGRLFDSRGKKVVGLKFDDCSDVVSELSEQITAGVEDPVYCSGESLYRGSSGKITEFDSNNQCEQTRDEMIVFQEKALLDNFFFCNGDVLTNTNGLEIDLDFSSTCEATLKSVRKQQKTTSVSNPPLLCNGDQLLGLDGSAKKTFTFASECEDFLDVYEAL